MKGSTFTYKGVTFRSEGRLTDACATIASRYKGHFNLEGYNHAEFYQAAKSANAYDDMFTVVPTGETIIPCGGAICII